MSLLAAFDYNAAAFNGTSVPMVVTVILPFVAFGMSERITFGCLTYRAGFWNSTGSRCPVVRTKFTVLKGCRALFAASAGLVISSLYRAGSISRLIIIGCYFLVKYMGMAELCFNDISTLGTLNGVLLGSVTCMIRSMSIFAAFNDNSASFNGADMPVFIFIKLPLCAFGMSTVGGAVPSSSANLVAVCAVIVVLLYALAVCAGACHIVCGIFNLLCEAVAAGGSTCKVLVGCFWVILCI